MAQKRIGPSLFVISCPVPMPTGLVLISSLQLFLQNFFLCAILTYVTSYVTSGTFPLLRRLRYCCCCCRRRKHRRKIILDTDIGDDIDDALAVLLLVILHAIGVVEVVAIITSGQGNHQLRSKLVHTLACAVLGNDDGDGTCSLPIIAGRTKGTSKGHYMTHGGNNMHKKESFPVLDEKKKAWLLRTIANEYDSGHQITYLCIGLLDNLKYIQPPPSSISLCLMGGCFGMFFDGHQAPAAFPEYNVVHSIDSWQWAVRTFSNNLIVPLDVAGVCRFREWPLRLQSCPVAYRQMYEMWYHSPQLQGSRILEGTKNGTLSSIQFDACALYLCLYPEAADIKTMRVEVTSTGETRESTCIDKHQGHVVRVALSWKDQSGFNKWVLWLLTIVTQREATAKTAARFSTLFVIFVIFIKEVVEVFIELGTGSVSDFFGGILGAVIVHCLLDDWRLRKRCSKNKNE